MEQLKKGTVIMKAHFTCFAIAVLLAMVTPGIAMAGGNNSPVHPALQMGPIPSGLGVNIHFYQGTPQDLDMLTRAGVGIVRMDIGWNGGAPEPGKYNFEQSDQLVADMEKRHIRILFIIDYGNPNYDNGLSPHSDACRAAYARFCAAMAQRYAGKPIIWELWNEPNIGFWKPKPDPKAYMAWCRAVVPALRKADPNICIIGPAMSRIDWNFLTTCFQQGFLELVDGVSVHPYRSAKKGPETAVAEYLQLRALVDHYKPAGKTIPLISGEWGYSTVDFSPEEQGSYLARQWLTNLSLDIPISIWYDWHDDGTDPKEREHHFGTVTHDYTPKPAYTAMCTLISQLRGFKTVGRLYIGIGEDFVIAFRKGNTIKLAAWTTASPRKLPLPENCRVLSGVDYLGKPLETNKFLRLEHAPHYLTLATPVPETLLKTADIFP